MTSTFQQDDSAAAPHPAAASQPTSSGAAPADGTADGVPPVALTIAGSDSGGGAGIQADLATFAAHGVFGTTAITGITAQNTCGVTAVEPVSPAMVGAQVHAVVEDLPVAAVKTGMLATAEIVAVVVDLAAAGLLPQLVVDPVLGSTTGHRLADDEVVAAYRTLLPHAAVVTPNLPELAALVGTSTEALFDLEAATRAAEVLIDRGARHVLVKGGHRPADASGAVVDLLVEPNGAVHALRHRWIDTANSHGTGCTLAAAITARLAHDQPLARAVPGAVHYLVDALAAGAPRRLGHGAGPVAHFHHGVDAMDLAAATAVLGLHPVGR